MRLSSVFSRLDAQKISEAVRTAEERTSGEIVPLVVSSSDHYAYINFLGATIGQIVFALAGILLRREGTAGWIFLLQAIGFVIGYLMCRYVPFCKRILLSAETAEKQVHERAVRAFYEFGLYKTRDRTGVLILVSLLERRVEVLADTGIHARVSPGTWDGVVKVLITAVRRGDLSQGLVEAIALCGDILAREFPRTTDDINELSDDLKTDH